MRPALLLALLVPLTLASVAHAGDDAAQAAQAKTRFQAGAQAYREARYKDAIDLFLQANRLDPHPELIYNVGQAYEKLGDVPNALRSYREYLRLSPGASDRATVETSIRNLEARLRERGVQQVSIFSSPAGATLTLDQKIVGQTPWTGEISPGRHVVILQSTGFPDTAKEFILGGDRAMDLDIALARMGVGATTLGNDTQPKVEAKPLVETPKPVETGTHLKPWSFIAFGVGVAGFAGALGFELARKGAEDDARSATQIEYADKYSAMTSHQTAARALTAVGAVGIAAGGVLLFLDLRSAGDNTTQPKAALGCFGTTCGAFASGRF
ncbi:MAG: PEGA domain-containing protein [Minicystis sp.]